MLATTPIVSCDAISAMDAIGLALKISNNNRMVVDIAKPTICMIIVSVSTRRLRPGQKSLANF